MDKFDKAAATRTAIIAYVRDNPHASTRKTSDAIGMSLDSISRMMRAMNEVGGLAKHGEGQHITYTVLSDSTYNAAEARDRATHKRLESKARRIAEKGKPRRKAEPWRYVHTPDAPIPQQGGQGAVRRKTTIVSCAG